MHRATRTARRSPASPPTSAARQAPSTPAPTGSAPCGCPSLAPPYPSPRRHARCRQAVTPPPCQATTASTTPAASGGWTPADDEAVWRGYVAGVPVLPNRGGDQPNRVRRPDARVAHLMDQGYRYVAANRYRLFGRTCRLEKRAGDGLATGTVHCSTGRKSYSVYWNSPRHSAPPFGYWISIRRHEPMPLDDMPSSEA